MCPYKVWCNDWGDNMNCGVDLIEISRIKESIEEHGDAFVKRIFTEREIEYCELHRAAKYQHYAVRFAAKEAVAKMFGTGFNGSFDWLEIEVQNEKSGKPNVVLMGRARALLEELGMTKITVSLSHSKEYATCMVIGY